MGTPICEGNPIIGPIIIEDPPPPMRDALPPKFELLPIIELPPPLCRALCFFLTICDCITSIACSCSGDHVPGMLCMTTCGGGVEERDLLGLGCESKSENLRV
jgi:hypothetical protein